MSKNEQEAERKVEVEAIMQDDEMKQALLDLHARRRFGVEEYVKRKSGLFYHFNLDPVSFEAIQKSAENLEALGLKMSFSVIVRDAVRSYCEYTGRISSEDGEAISKRAYQLIKCMKGID